MSRPRRAVALLAVSATALLAPATASSAAPIQPVANVDIAQYLGTWKQLASIPQWFEIGCLRNTTATYSLNPDGTVRVNNRCGGPLNTTIKITGRARVRDTATNAQLQVTFLNLGGGYIYTGGTNYVIIGLAEDYSWAIVADPRRSSAFVLSRTATQPPEVVASIRGILRDNAIDPCRLRTTKVSGGAQTTGPYC